MNERQRPWCAVLYYTGIYVETLIKAYAMNALLARIRARYTAELLAGLRRDA
jgi:hypothetical protein